MPYGPRSTSDLVQLTGWDATALRNFALEDGTTYATIVQLMSAGLGALNAELYNDALISSLVGYSDEPTVEYRTGASNGFEEHTEFGRADPKRADTDGHMIPLRSFDRMLGWTWDYIRKARMSQIDADIADAMKDARDLFSVRLLRRAFTRGDDSGLGLGLGSAGYSPGFATAAANTNVDFIPPSFGGTAFTSAHEHYVGAAGGAWTTAILLDKAAELREHGHMPPYIGLVSQVDVAEIMALTGFVPTPNLTVNYGTGVSLANFAVNGDEITPGAYPFGALYDIMFYAVPRIPTDYGFFYKSYGANSQRNPLRVRVGRGLSRPLFIAQTDPNAGTGVYPIQNLMLFTEFGVGVGDRTNGTAAYVNNANWADATIS